MTLIELLISTTMLVILAGVLAGLAAAVQASNEYSRGHGDAAQHARVAIERISRCVSQSTAVGHQPGFAVFYDQVGSYQFPDTLLVWRPTGAPANPAGPPLVRELIIYCPNPSNPAQLLEITAPTDSRALPLDDQINQSPYRTIVEGLRTSSSTQRVVLTDLLRVSSTGSARTTTSPVNTLRAAVRFERDLRPSANELTDYAAGTATWQSLSWPQGVYGSRFGMRQSWLRMELQLMPGNTAASVDLQGVQAIPFLGSAVLYYEIER